MKGEIMYQRVEVHRPSCHKRAKPPGNPLVYNFVSVRNAETQNLLGKRTAGEDRRTVVKHF